MSTLSNSAMLAHLYIRQWSAYKYDRKASESFAVSNQIAPDTGRYNKALIRRDKLKIIQSIVRSARDIHNTYTAPWLDDGRRMLPTKMFLEYTANMRNLKGQFDAKVHDFITNDYPQEIIDAKTRLGNLFNPDDYPSAQDLNDRFEFETSLLPIPETQDFRIDLPEDTINLLKTSMDKELHKVNDNVKLHILERLYETINKAATMLAIPEKKFKDSLIKNIETTAITCSKLNISGDADIQRICAEAQTHACTEPVQRLRDVAPVRQDYAQASQTIAQKIQDMIHGQSQSSQENDQGTNSINNGSPVLRTDSITFDSSATTTNTNTYSSS